MITAQEARNITVDGKRIANEEFLKQVMSEIKRCAASGYYDAYIRNFDDRLYPTVDKLNSLGFRTNVDLRGRFGNSLEISWRNRDASWIHKVLTGG